ncbi:hypothetical protein X798_00159 [Onchocerca flexuosa]|uniref:Uncharacterized protein n=2 Tax=Onchocerca flexuosa TaxID=387005 RepID=A0A183I486_9BILA|nr:hypothetical protein X798_00159 [Onchocerca flexuosa]VDP17564.1 unnamed protein product [Onchocerca flexuosa]
MQLVIEESYDDTYRGDDIGTNIDQNGQGKKQEYKKESDKTVNEKDAAILLSTDNFIQQQSIIIRGKERRRMKRTRMELRRPLLVEMQLRIILD